MAEDRVTIVDYGAGNLRSVAKAVEKLGYTPHVTGEARELLQAKAVIFPGQGASESAMTALHRQGLVEPVKEVISRGVPFFGVCLGLQLLLETSEEGPTPCLGLMRGKVRLLPLDVKRPHMGWNQVALSGTHPVFDGVESGSYFYFVHSYYADPQDDALVLGTTDYGVAFCSVIARDNLVATQFHPEKSGTLGLRLYENFLRLAIREGVRS
ncbi:MAG: imidazole glycerol phosphate synthase subunit HisH [Chloroflexi bacterium]|nr:imidazole glycerol phosphate synthase subunit HisH [Chloroflexota bacterium]